MAQSEKKMKMTQEEKTALVVPNDVISDILARLPAKSVGRFGSLSKFWLSMTKSPIFVQSHTQHSRATRQSIFFYRIDDTPAYRDDDVPLSKLRIPCTSKIAASCDGLLCLVRFVSHNSNDRCNIFNPLINHFHFLPTNRIPNTRIFAFYFHNSTYHLIEVSGDDKIPGPDHQTNILSISDLSRRPISCRLQAFCNPCYPTDPTDVNGSLHWLAWKQKPLSDGYTKPRPNIIMTFDKESEVYGLLSLPPPEKLRDRESNLMAFNGELGLWVADNFGIDLWVMQKQWIKKDSVNFIDVHQSPIFKAKLGLGPLLAVNQDPIFELHRNDPIWLPAITVAVGDEVIINIIVPLVGSYIVRWNLKSGVIDVRIWATNRNCRSFPYFESLLDPRSW